MGKWTELEVEWPIDVDVTVQVVLLGFMTIRVGLAVWNSARPGSWIDTLAIWALFVAGAALAIVPVIDTDLDRWGRPLAYLVLVAYALSAASLASDAPALGTDALMFSKLAALGFLAGENPYTLPMQASFDLSGAAHQVSTARLDGSMVNTWSYPAGSILAFAPAAAAGIQIRFVVLLATTAIGAILVALSPSEWALAGLASTIVARDIFLGSIGGLIDPLWMLPALLAMVLWARERWLIAAFVLGLAVGTKQHAWFLLPFLAVWVWRASSSPRDFGRQALRLTAAGAAGALALNLPFILMDPGAWLHGILTPVRGSPMVPLGVGLTLLTRIGLYPVASWWHTLVTALVGTWLLAWYAATWPRTRWLAWVLPAAVLFVHYRSLPSYVFSWLPMIWVGVLIQQGRLEVPSLPTLPVRGRPSR